MAMAIGAGMAGMRRKSSMAARRMSVLGRKVSLIFHRLGAKRKMPKWTESLAESWEDKLKNFRLMRTKHIYMGHTTWKAEFDGGSGEYYYYNNKTGECQWDKPKNFAMAGSDEQLRAALRMQVAFRRHMYKVHAATCIQSRYRSWLAGKTLRGKRLDVKKEAASAVIQVGVRGFLAKLKYKRIIKVHQAQILRETSITRVVCGCNARKLYRKLFQLYDDAVFLSSMRMVRKRNNGGVEGTEQIWRCPQTELADERGMEFILGKGARKLNSSVLEMANGLGTESKRDTTLPLANALYLIQLGYMRKAMYICCLLSAGLLLIYMSGKGIREGLQDIPLGLAYFSIGNLGVDDFTATHAFCMKNTKFCKGELTPIFGMDVFLDSKFLALVFAVADCVVCAVVLLMIWSLAVETKRLKELDRRYAHTARYAVVLRGIERKYQCREKHIFRHFNQERYRIIRKENEVSEALIKLQPWKKPKPIKSLANLPAHPGVSVLHVPRDELDGHAVIGLALTADQHKLAREFKGGNARGISIASLPPVVPAHSITSLVPLSVTGEKEKPWVADVYTIRPCELAVKVWQKEQVANRRIELAEWMARKFDPKSTTFFKADILRSMAAQSGGSMLDHMHRTKLRALQKLREEKEELKVKATEQCFKYVSVAPLEEYPAFVATFENTQSRGRVLVDYHYSWWLYWIRKYELLPAKICKRVGFHTELTTMDYPPVPVVGPAPEPEDMVGGYIYIYMHAVAMHVSLCTFRYARVAMHVSLCTCRYARVAMHVSLCTLSCMHADSALTSHMYSQPTAVRIALAGPREL
jgi:hypothetical protein